MESSQCLRSKCSSGTHQLKDEDGKTVMSKVPNEDGSQSGTDSGGYRASISGASKSDVESEESGAPESMSSEVTRRRSELLATANQSRGRNSIGEAPSDDPVKLPSSEFSQETKSYLDSVFSKACQDGSKEIFFVRACAPTSDKLPDDSHTHCSKVFENWHPPEVHASGVDPCLSDLAVYAASVGVPRDMLCSETCCEFMGLDGGLQGFVKLIDPQLV
eukprot:130718-Pyramimonas_sp.AAC.1